jgi:hypothetical protein
MARIVSGEKRAQKQAFFAEPAQCVHYNDELIMVLLAAQFAARTGKDRPTL